jgi:hypothetical protein
MAMEPKRSFSILMRVMVLVKMTAKATMAKFKTKSRVATCLKRRLNILMRATDMTKVIMVELIQAARFRIRNKMATCQTSPGILMRATDMANMMMGKVGMTVIRNVGLDW